MKHVSSDFAWFILSAIATVFAAPIASYAGAIPAAQAILNSQGTEIHTFGALGPLTTTNAFGSGTSAVSASYDGSTASALTASVMSTPVTNSPPGSGAAILDYYFEVVPVIPVLTTDVPYLLLFDIEIAAACPNPAVCGTTYAFTSAEVYGGTPATIDILQQNCTSATTIIYLTPNLTCFPSDSTNLVPSLYAFQGSAAVGDVYEVYLQVAADAGPGGISVAIIDPQILIDPSFPDAADYSLEVSAFTQSTPEPGTIALLGLGLAGLSFSRRKQ